MPKRKPTSRRAATRQLRATDGLVFVCVRNIAGKRPQKKAGNLSDFARAIQRAFPETWSHPKIARRYLECYAGLPIEDAILAVSKGYSSPDHAMRAGLIKKRRYIGFRED